MILNKKVPLWLFIITLIFAVAGFTLWGTSNLKHYDREYGLYAEAYFSKVKVLGLIEQNKLDEAKNMLQSDTEPLGVAVAICLMNDCSKRAKAVRDEYKKP